MATKFILAALSVLFIGLGLTRLSRTGTGFAAQVRTWLIIGVMFGAVSIYLFYLGS